MSDLPIEAKWEVPIEEHIVMDFDVIGCDIIFSRPEYVLTNQSSDNYILTDKVPIGNDLGDYYGDLSDFFFPIRTNPEVRKKVFISKESTKNILNGFVRQFTEVPFELVRQFEQSGVFTDRPPVRLYLHSNVMLIINRFLHHYNLDGVILSDNKNGMNTRASLFETTYENLKILGNRYDIESKKIRVDVSTNIVENYKSLIEANDSLNFPRQAQVSSYLVSLNDQVNDIKSKNMILKRLIHEKHKEKVYDDFLCAHPYILNLSYCGLQSEKLTLDSTPKRYPDFYIAHDCYGICDIWEFKKPQEKIFYTASYRKKLFSLTKAIIGSISQAKHYIEIFKGTRQNEYYKLPKGFVLVGNLQQESKSLGVEIDILRNNLRMYNDTLHGIEIITYDHIVSKNENMINFINENPSEKAPTDQ